MQFVLDNAGYILAALGLYTGGCYTPRTWDAGKARVLAWFAARLKR